MPWYIYNPGLPAARQFKGGKTKFNGDAPFFFFPQSVCILPGQRFNQRCLAMIYMASRADDYVRHRITSSSSASDTVRKSSNSRSPWTRPTSAG
ncbi:MAG: hypothetical protein DDT34_01790 [Firmicutes bacterium]|nr:hypothetical protein [Bacillota bacterium]